MYTPTNITPTEDIAKHLTEIQSYIEAHYTADNPTAVVDRVNDLESYMALSGKLHADAEHHYNTVVQGAIMGALKDALETRLQTSTLNKYIEAAAKDYKYLVTWSERVNRSCTHQIDVCRTIISKLKQEMYYSQSTRQT